MSEAFNSVPITEGRRNRLYRALIVLILGFASGIPLALTGGAMQAWLTIEGLDLATIGFLGLVGLPYTFKFLWAPLMDRFEPPLLGRRRGWIVLMLFAVAACLYFLSLASPTTGLTTFSLIALCVAFSSASLDIVIDAYRTDLLPSEERGLGASLSVLGYRVAMVISGGITLLWAEQWGSWPKVYGVMATLMIIVGVFCIVALPKVHSDFKPLASSPRSELFGFLAMLLGVAAGYYLGELFLVSIGFDAASEDKWIRLYFVMTQLIFGLTFGLWLSRKVGFVTLNQSLDSYFSNKSAWAFLIMIVLYKLGDAFAMSLTTPFLMRGLGFDQTEVGLANKSIGLLMTIFGAVIGGLIMLRVRLVTALLGFGVLQLVSNLGYYALAVLGKGAWGSIEMPAFNLLIAKLPEATSMDTLMLSAIGIDNLSGGMGTAALVALLMSLCNKKFSATHFALLSAFASLGRVFIGPFSGVLAEEIGWPAFFLSSLVVAAPGVMLIYFLRRQIDSLSNPEASRS